MRNQRGIILILTLFFAILIAIFTTSLFALSISERRQIDLQSNRIIAFQLAESGIDIAIAQLAADRSYSGTGTSPVSLGKGVYDAIVTQPDAAGNPLIRKIVSTGYAPSNQNTAYAYQERAVTVYVQVTPKPLFTNAIFAASRVVLKGNSITDSYDSALGPYGGTNIQRNGQITSNTTATGKIEFTGNTQVHGDVVVGPGADPDSVIFLSGRAAIDGTKRTAVSTQEYKPAEIPEGLASSGNLEIGSDQVRVLQAGTYRYERIHISGNGQLVLEGPVTIYAADTVKLKGDGVITAANLPANFTLNIVGDNAVEISGSGTLYGMIYAPESGKRATEGVSVNGIRLVGNAEIFGAAIAYDFIGNHASIHYDEALSRRGDSSENTVSLVSWQEA